MSGRFRPTSFRVAFGNDDMMDDQQPVQPPLAPVVVPSETPREVVKRIQIEEDKNAVQFEQVLVREMPCNMCDCYRCAYRRRQDAMKLNIIIFLLAFVLIVLIIHVGNK